MGIGPGTTFSGTTAPTRKERPGPDRWFIRMGVYVLAFLMLPVAAVIAGVSWILFHYARMRWWYPLPVAVLGFVAVLATGGFGNAIDTQIDYVGAAFSSIGSDDGFGGWLSGNLGGILLAQLPLSLLAGGLWATVAVGWRWMRRPAWEHRTINPGPVLKKRLKDTTAEIAAGANPPKDGVTVGVSVDLRDPRFAGGKPGAAYGTRAVLTDAEGAGHCLVVGGSGSGKALDVDTPIPTPNGFVRMGDLKSGDAVFGSDGLVVTVTGAFDVMYDHDCFEVVFSDGSIIVADADHLWNVQMDAVDTTVEVTVSTRQMLDELNNQASFGSPRVTLWLPNRIRPHDDRVPAIAHRRRHVLAIRPVASRPVRCIAVDAPDRLFLAGETYIPTHNTTTMMVGMRDVIQRGHGLIVVDPKGSQDIPRQIAEWAAEYGRDFYHWQMFDVREGYQGPADGPAFYDPISRGDPSRRKDLLIGSQANAWQGAAEYYKSIIGDYMQTMFQVIDLVPAPPGVDTFKDVSMMLSPTALLARAATIPKDRYPDLAMALTHIGEMGDREKSAIANMYARLNTLTSSTAGPWLRRGDDDSRNIDLVRVADEGAVVVFSLDSDAWEETTALLAGLIVQDLKTAASALREFPPATPLHVYIDEFSSLDATNVYGLLAKARDARIPVTLATQVLADLRRREDHFDEQVIGIVSSFLIHRANSEDDARIFSGLAGVDKRMAHRVATEGTTGMMGMVGASSATGGGYLQEEETYRVDPGAIQRLKQGQCVLIAKMPEDRFIYPVQVVREDHTAMTGRAAPAEPERRVRPVVKRAEVETFPYPGRLDAGQSTPVIDTMPDVDPVTPGPVPAPAVPVVDPADAGSGPVRPSRPVRPSSPPPPPPSRPVPVVPTGAKPAAAPVPGLVTPPARGPMTEQSDSDDWGTV